MMLNSVSDDFRGQLHAALPRAAFPDLTPQYLEEPRGRFRGRDGFLIAPDCASDVAKVVKACARARIGVIPFGGGTGLVGGQIAQDESVPVILSLARMTKIRDIFPSENLLVAEAGVTLQVVQEAAQTAQRLFPLSLASEGSARIGGVLATNAGGVNVLRYGNARDLCLGLEVVLPDGSLWNGLTRLHKDNAGYDLRHLLIGAEGSLGVITAASLKLFARPAQYCTAMFAVTDPQAALELFTLTRDRVGPELSAFELIGRQGLEFLGEVGPEVQMPFANVPDWMVLIDIGAMRWGDAEKTLEELFVAASERGLVQDGVVAQSQAQRARLWRLRESIPEANRRIGSISSHDISVPIGSIAEFIARGDAALTRLRAFRINCFGHIGDGNLHYNVFPPKNQSRDAYEHLRDDIKHVVHDLVHQLEGSVAAEHGIGRLKVDDLQRYGAPAKLAAMRAIKEALDPAGIMNPGVVVPPQTGRLA